MNLRCALVYGAEAWKQVLKQCGVPTIEGHGTAIDTDHASVLVVDGRLSREDGNEVRDVLARGGAVLGSAADVAPAIGMETRRAYLRYVLDDRDDRWCDLLDLETWGDIPREANLLKTDTGNAAVFAGRVMAGWAVLLPFNLQKLWETFSKSYRQFPARYDRQPFELVSTVPRAELAALVNRAIEHLHHCRDLPYARLWPFPGEAPSVLAVRLDTDKATRADIDAFVRCSRTSGVPFTWFVDTGSHEHFLDAFRGLDDQEIGIHCHRHVVYRSVDDYRTDIRLARTQLAKQGITANGYAAPFGEWTTELGEAIDDSQLLYSSEFTLGYDGFPFAYRSGSKHYATPQIPVHPVSTGALRRAGYSRDRMTQYYCAVATRKFVRQEPVVLFDHPVHGNAPVIGEVAREVLRRGAVPVRFSDYLEWWKKREAVRETLTLEWEDNRIVSALRDGQHHEPSVLLRITTPSSAWFSRPGELTARGDARIPDRHVNGFFTDDLRRSREFDLRTAFGVCTTMVLRRIHQ